MEVWVVQSKAWPPDSGPKPHVRAFFLPGRISLRPEADHGGSWPRCSPGRGRGERGLLWPHGAWGARGDVAPGPRGCPVRGRAVRPGRGWQRTLSQNERVGGGARGSVSSPATPQGARFSQPETRLREGQDTHVA